MTVGNVDTLVTAIAQGQTVRAAAEAANMSERSAFRYLQRPEVAKQVDTERDAIRRTMSCWLDQIVMVGDLALDCVVGLLSDPATPPHVLARISVAVMTERRALVEAVEMDIRLTRLETMASGRDPGDPDGRARLRRAVDGKTTT